MPYRSWVYATALAELRARWREGNHHIGKDDIARWSELSGLSVKQVFDALAVELSCDFWVGFLGYDFVHGAANALYWALLKCSEGDETFAWPDSFWEFFLAFDRSEMEGPRDKELIREFLQKHRTLFG